MVSATSEVFSSASFQNGSARSARSEQSPSDNGFAALVDSNAASASGDRFQDTTPPATSRRTDDPPPAADTRSRDANNASDNSTQSASDDRTTAGQRGDDADDSVANTARPSRNRPRSPTIRNRRKNRRRGTMLPQAIRPRSIGQDRSGQPGCGNSECGCGRDSSCSDRNRCRCVDGAGLRQGHRAACDRRSRHRRRIVRHPQRFDRHADGIRHRCRRRRNARRCQGRRRQDRAAGGRYRCDRHPGYAGRRDSAERHRAGGFRHSAGRAENGGNAQRPSRCEGWHHVTR